MLFDLTPLVFPTLLTIVLFVLAWSAVVRLRPQKGYR